MSLKRLTRLTEGLLDALYLASNPPISWEEIKVKYANVKDPWYRNHRIKRNKYTEIKEKFYKDNKVTRSERRSLSMSLLMYSPTEEE